MNADLVSIVMPAYNGADFIDEAIESCIGQTWQNWELIIVDDASTDRTPERIRHWESIEPRIRSIRHAANRGLPQSLNTGIGEMSGEYYTWLSADDEFRSRALTTMAKFLIDRPTVDVVYTDYSEIDADGNHIRRIDVGDADLLGVGNPTGVCHLRRSQIFDEMGLYAEDLFLAEDLDMWIRMHAQFELRVLHEDLFRYRQHDASLTSKEQRRVYLVHEQVLDRHVDRMRWLDADGKAWAYIRLARTALYRRDLAACARLAGKSIRLSPSFVPRKSLSRLRSTRAHADRPGGIDRPDEIETERPNESRRLVWVYTEPLDGTLDSATWVETSTELEQLGWDVTLAAVGDGGWGSFRGAKTWLTPRPSGYGIGQIAYHLKVGNLIRKADPRPDVVLFHEMSAVWFLALKPVLKFGRKATPQFVLDSRTLHMTERRNEGLKDRIRRRLYDTVRLTAGWWTDGQLAITPRLAAALDLAEPRLWGVWPSGVSTEPFRAAAVDRRFPEADDAIRLIYIGSLAAERNLLPLVGAVEKAVADGMRFEFVIIGGGSGAQDLKTAAADRTFIQVLDPVPHTEIPKHLAEAHIGVLPFPDELMFQVSSPIKLFEYMASGLNVMATKIVCHTDVVDGEAFVHWIDEAADEQAMLEALRQIWHHRSSLEARSATAIEQSEDWTWQDSARKLHNALVDGISRSDRRRQ